MSETIMTAQAETPVINLSATDDSQQPPRTSRFSSVAQVAGIMVLLLAAIFGYGRWRTGSFDLVWPWIAGQQLLFSPTRIELGQVGKNEILERRIRVVNVSSKPLSLLGSQKSCGCIGLDEFPIEIAPGESRELRLRIATGVTPGSFAHSIKFFFDEQGYSHVIVPVTGTIR